jgi:hypothetical protein
MSKLGGKKMSEDTDRDNQTTGVVETIVAGDRISVNSSDPANPIVTADIQAGGQVDSVVGGTNCSVDATDPINPIVNADTQNNAKVTTKGDLEGFSTVAARIPVGTNGQHLEADSTAALGVKWATPAAGGGGVDGSIHSVPPGTGFGMVGISAGSVGALSASTLSDDRIYLDAIYFDGVTTVTELNVWVQTSNSAGINIHVGLHPMTDRGNAGAQAHGDIIVSVIGANQLYSKVLSTAWTPDKGWYFLATWCDVNVSGMTFNLTQEQHGVYGAARSAYTFTNSTNDVIEQACYILNDTDYDTAPDTRMQAADFNDASASYGFSTTNGVVWCESSVPLTILKAG